MKITRIVNGKEMEFELTDSELRVPNPSIQIPFPDRSQFA